MRCQKLVLVGLTWVTVSIPDVVRADPVVQITHRNSTIRVDVGAERGLVD